jgi:hypothetical protein
MALSPVPAEPPEASCANCGAQLVADQRYCLSCGQPVSPVRLAFLDVLAPSSPPPAGALPAAAWPSPATIEAPPGSYVAVQSQGGANAWLRRNSGLLGLVGVLAVFLLAGLLIGHWVSQSKVAPNTTVKIEGLSGLAAAGGATTTPTTSATPSEPASSTAAPAKTSAKQEAKEKAEGEHETAKEKAPPKEAKKVSKSDLKKLTESTGKKHQEEINAHGAEPIETT